MGAMVMEHELDYMIYSLLWYIASTDAPSGIESLGMRKPFLWGIAWLRQTGRGRYGISTEDGTLPVFNL
jgi:hypothetical protein